MTTAVQEPTASPDTLGGWAAPPTGSELPSPDDRGSVTVSPRAVERTAARVALGVTGVSDAPRRGRLGGRAEPVRVDVDLKPQDPTDVTVRIDLGVAYPTSVAATTRAVRNEVAGRLREWLGLMVTDCEVVVTRLPSTVAPRRVL